MFCLSLLIKHKFIWNKPQNENIDGVGIHSSESLFGPKTIQLFSVIKIFLKIYCRKNNFKT